MQSVPGPRTKKLPFHDFIDWMAPVGRAAKLLFNSLSLESIKGINWGELRYHCKWMGLDSFHFIAVSSLLISVALTIQCVVELQKYQAADISGAAISIGLLRELGPLTISVAWCARVGARISEEARNQRSRFDNDRDFARHFLPVRATAALCMSITLGAYGLAVGFITAALYAPMIGVNSSIDFAEAARIAITDKDIFVYFFKLIAINPLVGVFAGCASGLAARDSDMPVAAKAVTFTFLACYGLNLLITMAAFIEGTPHL